MSILNSLLKAFSNMDLSMHLFQVNLKMKLTYRTLPYDEDSDVQEPEGGITEAGGSPKSKHHNRKPWDDDCPWSEWYSAEDPVKGNYVSERVIPVSTIFPVIRSCRSSLEGVT